MSPTSHSCYVFTCLILFFGKFPHTLVRAQILSNFDTNTKLFPIGIAFGILVLLFALSFVGYHYCFVLFLRESPSRAWHRGTTRTGLDSSVLVTFPVFLCPKVPGHCPKASPLECPVCLGEFEPNEALRLLPKCGHVFHVMCVDTWLADHTSCPLCRADLVPRPDDPGRAYRPGGWPVETADEVVVEVRDEVTEGYFGKKRKCNSTGDLAKVESREEITPKLTEQVQNQRCNSCRQLYIVDR